MVLVIKAPKAPKIDALVYIYILAISKIIDFALVYEEASKKKVVRVVFFVQSALGLARVPESL